MTNLLNSLLASSLPDDCPAPQAGSPSAPERKSMLVREANNLLRLLGSALICDKLEHYRLLPPRLLLSTKLVKERRPSQGKSQIEWMSNLPGQRERLLAHL